jgi:PKD repeat protein
MNVTHSYDEDGTYTITLTVRFKGGATLTTSHQVTVYEQEARGDSHQPGPANKGRVMGIVADISLTTSEASVVSGRLKNETTLYDDAIAELMGLVLDKPGTSWDGFAISRKGAWV